MFDFGNMSNLGARAALPPEQNFVRQQPQAAQAGSMSPFSWLFEDNNKKNPTEGQAKNPNAGFFGEASRERPGFVNQAPIPYQPMAMPMAPMQPYMQPRAYSQPQQAGTITGGTIGMNPRGNSQNGRSGGYFNQRYNPYGNYNNQRRNQQVSQIYQPFFK